MKRVEEILEKSDINLNSDKIIWRNNPIARLKKGNNYLNPEIEIIADESLNDDSKSKFEIVSNVEIRNNEIMKIIIAKKYLFMSVILALILFKDNLFE